MTTNPAMPLPTVPQAESQVPAAFRNVDVADEPASPAPAELVDVDVDQPVAGIDYFEHDHASSGRAAVVWFALLTGLCGVLAFVATPTPVRAVGLALAVVFGGFAIRAARTRN